MIGIMFLLPEQFDTVHKTADGRNENVNIHARLHPL